MSTPEVISNLLVTKGFAVTLRPPEQSCTVPAKVAIGELAPLQNCLSACLCEQNHLDFGQEHQFLYHPNSPFVTLLI